MVVAVVTFAVAVLVVVLMMLAERAPEIVFLFFSTLQIIIRDASPLVPPCDISQIERNPT